jgi:hypothetical protein
MAELDRKTMEAIYELFDTFALDDQRNYYRSTVSKFRKAAQQVNTLRASFSFLTGLASALAGVLAMTQIPPAGCPVGDSACGAVSAIVGLLIIISIVAPAIGGAFNTLADLFQWDRLVTVYSAALENIEVADSRSPDPEMDDFSYRIALNAYVDGTLSVMSDESAQWGQLIRTPAQIEKFIRDATLKAEAERLKVPGAKPESESGSSGSSGEQIDTTTTATG